MKYLLILIFVFASCGSRKVHRDKTITDLSLNSELQKIIKTKIDSISIDYLRIFEKYSNEVNDSIVIESGKTTFYGNRKEVKQTDSAAVVYSKKSLIVEDELTASESTVYHEKKDIKESERTGKSWLVVGFIIGLVILIIFIWFGFKRGII